MLDCAEKEIVTGRAAVLSAFDRLFDKAAAKIQVECSQSERNEAKRVFAERAAAALETLEKVNVSGFPNEVLCDMEAAIEQVSPAQLAGYLATVPLLHQTQEMVRAVAYRDAELRLIEHLVSHADDRYGGN